MENEYEGWEVKMMPSECLTLLYRVLGENGGWCSVKGVEADPDLKNIIPIRKVIEADGSIVRSVAECLYIDGDMCAIKKKTHVSSKCFNGKCKQFVADKKKDKPIKVWRVYKRIDGKEEIKQESDNEK